MKQIGNVILELRKKARMSRKSLCENICSEKYLYLIEKGERTPSIFIARLLSDKLGVDLFKYYEYLDCQNPIEMEAAVYLFNKYRNESNITALKALTDEVMNLPDFQTAPWIYEIEINRIAHLALIEGEHRKAISEIEGILQEMDPRYANSIFMANIYILLSICYQIDKDILRAKDANTAAYDIIYSKWQIKKYIPIMITVVINKITLLYLSEEYDGVIQEGLSLAEYQKQANSFDYLPHTFIYLAFAYYQKGQEDEGISWFNRCLCIMSFSYKPLDMFYFSRYEIFDVLMNDLRVPRETVNEIKKIYNL
ncbi:MAG: helix-turn-helix transcriptional regulator [Eubacteriales bacterium]|nr:helix-turn-helix transcriptional regulator [Eubacteriales bacterium]MDD4565014.1 helix-turn-helix transcriptional regulator [Eubacteriales bacterium]